MSDYLRYFVPGATYFFTVVTERRARLFADESARTPLGEAMRQCQARHPFKVIAMVLLPDHRNRSRQRRFQEHTIEDETDLENHFDYTHYNPVKHKLVARPRDWPASTFHRWVARGHYDINWGAGNEPPELPGGAGK